MQNLIYDDRKEKQLKLKRTKDKNFGIIGVSTILIIFSILYFLFIHYGQTEIDNPLLIILIYITTTVTMYKLLNFTILDDLIKYRKFGITLTDTILNIYGEEVLITNILLVKIIYVNGGSPFLAIAYKNKGLNMIKSKFIREELTININILRKGILTTHPILQIEEGNISWKEWKSHIKSLRNIE